MGHKVSKKVNISVSAAENHTDAGRLNDNEYELCTQDEYDKKAIECLRKSLDEEPNIFILNLLLMSFVFFEDYQAEIKCLATIPSKRTQKLNLRLMEPHQKQLMVLDRILGRVNRRIKFQSMVDNKLESLLDQRFIILHNNLEVLNTPDKNVEERLDSTQHYRGYTQWDQTEPGFVQVQINKENRPSSNSDEFLNTYPRDDSGISTTLGSDSECGLSHITSTIDSKILEISEKNIYTHINQLPTKCITVKKLKNIPETNTMFKNEETSDSENNSECFPELFITRNYLSSEEFLKHFNGSVFPQCLAEILDISDYWEDSILGITYGKKFDSKKYQRLYKITPAVSISWPDHLEWPGSLELPLSQDVSVLVIDKRKGTKSTYKWPTDNMVDRVRKFKAVIIPKGFSPRKGKNIYKSIEWELAFPAAEQYLEFRMSHQQIRIFVYLILIFKTFIEPETKSNGILIDHIRCLIFWECEINCVLWPEDQLGTKLIQILEKLIKHLGKEHLPHYFIRERNTFKNVPSSCLRYAQNAIHRIVESPTIHMMYALHRLQYINNNKSCPVPNLDELYKIMTADFVGKFKLTKEVLEDNVVNETGEQTWEKLYIKRQKLKKQSILVTKNLINQKASVFDLELPLTEFDQLRKTSLLKYFVQHFLKIAHYSHELGNTSQQSFYLKQAYYLTELMESDIESARDFQDQIKACESNTEKCKKDTKSYVESDHTSRSFEPLQEKENGLKWPQRRVGNTLPNASRFRKSMETLTVVDICNEENGSPRLKKSVSFRN